MGVHPPVIMYNLFPRLAGTLDRWNDHAIRIKAMGFGWIYLNPIHPPGLSGSLYAIKDYYQINREILPLNSSSVGLSELRECLKRFRELGLKTAVDLVINHTAIDNPLVISHPNWYVRDLQGKVVHPSVVDPTDTTKVTVWGDLAEVDNENSVGKEELWGYWGDLVSFYQELGFDGFRCDAAYKVPAGLWKRLITEAKRRNPETLFFAETLGCSLEQVRRLNGTGFDFLYNSSKYWQFDQPWALQQHEEFGNIAPSVSFPESHDTPRLMQESGGNEELQRQRYLFAAVFSAALMMPIGYEFGFKRTLHVVKTTPEDWEKPSVDLTLFIRDVNELKHRLPLLSQEGHLELLTPLDFPFLVLKKFNDTDRLWIIVNKDKDKEQRVALTNVDHVLGDRLFRFYEGGRLPVEKAKKEILLYPAEIVVVV